MVGTACCNSGRIALNQLRRADRPSISSSILTTCSRLSIATRLSPCRPRNLSIVRLRVLRVSAFKTSPGIGSIVTDDEGVDGPRQRAAGADLRLPGGGRTHEGRPVGYHELLGAEEAPQGDRLRAVAAEVMPHVAVTIDEAIDVAEAAKVRQGRGPIR